MNNEKENQTEQAKISRLTLIYDEDKPDGVSIDFSGSLSALMQYIVKGFADITIESAVEEKVRPAIVLALVLGEFVMKIKEVEEDSGIEQLTPKQLKAITRLMADLSLGGDDIAEFKPFTH